MFNAPNITGPRFRKKYKNVLSSELYEKFIKSHPQYSTLTFDKFKDVIEKSSKMMWETTIAERDGIELPIGGSVFIGSVKIKVKNNYDIQASIKANAPVKHRNYETDGYSAKIMYSPYLSRISGRDRSIWSFKGVREYKRTLSAEYAKDWKKYIVPANLYKLVDDYQRHKARNYFENNIKKATEVYNEFDLN